MLTTLQVRKIINSHIVQNPAYEPVYTNRWDNCGQVRSVKCYAPTDLIKRRALLAALRAAAGNDNVNVTSGTYWTRREGITVRCVLPTVA